MNYKELNQKLKQGYKPTLSDLLEVACDLVSAHSTLERYPYDKSGFNEITFKPNN